MASRWQSCSSLRSLPATVTPTCSRGKPSRETTGPGPELPDWAWTLASHTGGGRAGACCSSAASRISAKGNAFSPLSKDSRLGISRPAGVGEHPQHEGLLPSGAQAGILNRARWSLVILPCRTLEGSSHEVGLVCCPSEPLALERLPAPFGQVFICKGVGAQRSLLPFLGR